MRVALKREERTHAPSGRSSDLSAMHLFQELRVIQKGIYGTDDRREIGDAPEFAGELARSVAVMIDVALLEQSGSSWALNDRVKSLQDSRRVCPTEPYAPQPTAGSCSAFLSKPNVLLTAAHCIEGGIGSVRFVFGYWMNGQAAVRTFSSASVYRAARVLDHRRESDGTDWAAIELDRPVTGIDPLAVDRAGTSRNASVFVIGSPVGLPLKYAAGARVRFFKSSTPYFTANLDTFGGNSGSPVFSAANKVVGVFSRGGVDFSYHGPDGCGSPLVCPMGGCRGEDATKIDQIPGSYWQ